MVQFVSYGEYSAHMKVNLWLICGARNWIKEIRGFKSTCFYKEILERHKKLIKLITYGGGKLRGDQGGNKSSFYVSFETILTFELYITYSKT